MQWQGMKPSVITVVSVLPVCACLSALQQGKKIHVYVIRNGLESYVFIGNSLIHMYGKCMTFHTCERISEIEATTDCLPTGYQNFVTWK